MYMRRYLYIGASAMTLLCSLVFVLEREISERKCGEEDAIGFLGGRSSCVFSSALLDRTWERWSGAVAWWGSVLSYVATEKRFGYEEALLVRWKSETSSPLFS